MYFGVVFRLKSRRERRKSSGKFRRLEGIEQGLEMVGIH